MIVITFDTEAERAAILAAVAEGAPFGAESYVVRNHRGGSIAGGSMANFVTAGGGQAGGVTCFGGGAGTGTITACRGCCGTAPGTGHLSGCEVAEDARRRGVPSP